MKRVLMFLKSFTNKLVYVTFSNMIGIFGTIIGICSSCGLDAKTIRIILYVALSILALTTIALMIYVYSQKRIFEINNTKVCVESGDIFANINCPDKLTVINMDSCFNTLVDDHVISHSSIHGQYIDKYWKGKVEDLDKEINNQLEDRNVDPILLGDVGKHSKQQKYELGEYVMLENNSVFAFAFSNLDKDYKAKLDVNEYITSLTGMWKNINQAYAGRKDIYLPLLGSGIVRICEIEKDPNVILSLMLNTLKIIKMKFHSETTIHIVLLQNDLNKIDFIKLSKNIIK